MVIAPPVPPEDTKPAPPAPAVSKSPTIMLAFVRVSPTVAKGGLGEGVPLMIVRSPPPLMMGEDVNSLIEPPFRFEEVPDVVIPAAVIPVPEVAPAIKVTLPLTCVASLFPVVI